MSPLSPTILLGYKDDMQLFLDLSAALYSTYYHVQILIHRPFIAAPGKAAISSVSATGSTRYVVETRV